MIFYMLMFLMSCLFMMSSHPVNLLIITMLQTFMISAVIWTKMLNSWLSLILFLIFIGGLMVLFVYIVSLASNETFNLTAESNMNLFMIMIISLLMMWMTMKNYNALKIINFEFLSQFNKIYSSTPSNIILFTMMYLLLTLIVTVKISSFKEAPMKNSFY